MLEIRFFGFFFRAGNSGDYKMCGTQTKEKAKA